MAKEHRFVGRAPELAELELDWRRAAAGRFRCVLLSGEPGVGKTRLADETLERQGASALALRAKARPLSATASFGLWADALESHLRTLPREEVSILCGGLVDDLASLLRSAAAVRGKVPDREPPRPRLLGSLSSLMANLARQKLVVLVFNDIHLADASSWEVLHYLAEQLADSRILVIATARSGELAEQASAVQVLLDLEEMGALTRLEVSPLDDPALAELAEDVLGGAVGKEVLDWLWDRSRGVPLFAVGLLHALRDEGDIGHPGLRSLPEELTARVRARVNLLDRPAQAVLEMLAVTGGHVELGELVRYTTHPLDELAPILDRLVRSRLVVEEQHGRAPNYEITHPLIQETIYEEIGGARRYALHRHVARSLLIMGRLGEAALHFARSAEMGDDEAIQVLLQSLEQSEERGAYREGLKVLGFLVDLIPPGDQRWLSVADALFGEAEWVIDHRADADARSAVAALREIDALLDGTADLVRRAAVKSRLTSFLSWGTGQMEQAAAAAQQAIELHRLAGQPTQARLAALELAYARGLNGDIPALSTGAQAVLAEAEAAGDEEAALWAVGVYGTTALYQGHFEAAEVALRRSVELARRLGRPYRATWGLMSLGWSLGFEGRLKESYEAFGEAKASPGWRETNVLEIEAYVRWVAGDLRGSLDCAREVVLLNPGRVGYRRGMSLVCQALCGIELGELAEARRAVAGLRQIYGSRVWFMASGLARHAEATLTWREGRLPDAVDALQRAALELVSVGAPIMGAFVLLDLSEAVAEAGTGEATGRLAADRLAGIAAQVDRPLYHGMADTARAWSALADGRPSLAAEAAVAAVELLRPLEYPWITARAYYALGRALEGRDPPGSIAALQEAAERFEAAGSAWRRDRALNLLRAMGRPGRRAAGAALGAHGLTARELEVARLGATRLSASEIAGRLFISRRTVETHLASVYAKLGVSSRAELAEILAELSA